MNNRKMTLEKGDETVNRRMKLYARENGIREENGKLESSKKTQKKKKIIVK